MHQPIELELVGQLAVVVSLMWYYSLFLAFIQSTEGSLYCIIMSFLLWSFKFWGPNKNLSAHWIQYKHHYNLWVGHVLTIFEVHFFIFKEVFFRKLCTYVWIVYNQQQVIMVQVKHLIGAIHSTMELRDIS